MITQVFINQIDQKSRDEREGIYFDNSTLLTSSKCNRKTYFKYKEEN